MGEADELAYKWPWWTTETVNERLASAFAAPDVPAASTLLAALVGEVPEADLEASARATCRLMLAALKVSEGDLTRLALWIEVARTDPRDLIGAAEYRRELTGEGESVRDADLAEYVAWCAHGPRHSEARMAPDSLDPMV